MARRTLPTALVLTILLAAPARLWAQVDSEFLAKIHKAIDTGVVWLKAKQVKTGADKGSWGISTGPLYPGGSGAPHDNIVGIAALSLLTLLKCEVDPDDPVIVDGFAFINGRLGKGWKSGVVSTYETAVLMMAIEALYDGRTIKADKSVKRDPKIDKMPPIKLDPAHDALVKEATAWLIAQQTTEGGWRYGASFPAPLGLNEDISVTQVCLLGLISADRMGAPIDAEVWRKAAKYNMHAQEKDGPPAKASAAPSNGMTVTIKEGDKQRGWSYIATSTDDNEKRVCGSMTASGICSQIIAKAQLTKAKKITPTMDKDLQRSIFDGIAWLEGNWSVQNNPSGHRSHYYYLYGLERVGMLGGLEMLGTHNWYLEGATVLVGSQEKDGHWDSRTELAPGDVLDSCFALLFLKKATLRVTVLTH